MFELQARHHPRQLALIDDERTVTYQELDRWSARLASRLYERGPTGPRPVVVLMRPKATAVVAMLAVLRANATFVCLDLEAPGARLALQLDDLRPSVVVRDETIPAATLRTIAGWCETNNATATTFDQWDSTAGGDGLPAPSARSGSPPAYIAYTSGSTGPPKGIVMPRAALSQFLRAWIAVTGTAPSDRVAQWAPLSYDAAYAEIFGTLAAGATVCCPNGTDRRDPEAMLDWLGRASITVWLTVPTFLRQVVDQLAALDAPSSPPSLRAVLVAGELFPADLAAASRRTWPLALLFNLYGPSESILATAMPVDEVRPEWGSVPVGTALDGREVLILDANGASCPTGTTGEVFIRSDHLASGYWRRPAETAAVFVPDQGRGRRGQRLYRTGDLARMRPDGLLEFVGRRDFQVKLRGQRVELGEVEVALRGHPTVAEALVTPLSEGTTVSGLVAYVVPARSTRVPPAERLRRFLLARLPAHVVPAAYVVMDELPTTRSGKVDRKALPVPEPAVADGEDAFVAPRSEAERRVVEAFAEVLGVDRISARADFFAVGGHSILAARVANRLRASFGPDVSMQTVFESPTAQELAARLAARASPARAGEESPRGPTRPATLPLGPEREPLSFAQRRLWFLQQLEPAACDYNMLLGLRLRGRLDRRALERALEEILNRHAVLRTTIELVDGEPLQVVAPSARLTLSDTDLSGLGRQRAEERLLEVAAEEWATPFDLAKGPMIRARLLSLWDERHALLLTLHHIVADAWSVGILRRELDELYDAFLHRRRPRLEPLTDSYSDYAAWQLASMQGQKLAEDLAYWRGRLRGLEPLQLPADKPRPAIRSGRGGSHRFVVPARVVEGLRALGLEAGTTSFMTLLSAFFVLLGRYSGQQDVAVGTPVAGRNRVEDEALLGCYVNTLVLRGDLRGDPSFRALLERVRRVAVEAYAHQELPFEKLVEELAPERDLRRNPLFQVMFETRAQAEPMDKVGDLEAERLELDPSVSIFDLSLTLVDTDEGGMRATIQYSTDLFERHTIERFTGHFLTLLSSVVADPDQSIAKLGMLAPEERDALLMWAGPPATDLEDGCLRRLFEAQVERTPEAVAVICGAERLRYDQLNASANQLAHELRGRGVGPEVLVGIYLERGISALVAILGILKAGGGYVPLDTAHPAGRLAYILEDSGVRLVVTQESLRDRLPAPVRHVICPDRPPARPVRDPEPAVHAGNVAYMIYTSGSTGRPKGVLVENRSAVRYVRDYARLLELSSADRVYQFATLSFDTHVAEIFPSLARGATLVLRSPEAAASVPQLLTELERHRITVSDLPTAYWHELCAWLESERGSLPADLRLVVIGGERALRGPLTTWHELVGTGVRLLNTYGPTEATVVVCAHDLAYLSGAHEGSEIPVGRPRPGVTAHVLDRYLEPVPVGIPGELYLGGRCPARGYLRRPSLTAERFLPDPFGAAGARLYRSGDLARLHPDGSIELIGRVDDQIKIRGYRVEPGEIENVLVRHPAIRDAAVIADRGPVGPALVAYVVAGDGQPPAPAQLRSFLSRALPSYMLPTAFEVVPRLPMTLSGKLDRKALPRPGWRHALGERTGAAPRSRVEAAVATIWAEALGHGDLGVDDSVFDLGAHSFMLMRVLTQLRKRFGVELSVRVLFEHQTVASLARRIEEELVTTIARMPEEEVRRLLDERRGAGAARAEEGG